MTAAAVDQIVKKATFAMGCFWGSDALFGGVHGVLRTRVGYCGGTMPNPTYKKLGDHTEAVDIDYDPKTVTYLHLLSLFWENHDPTIAQRTQYRSVIFYYDNEQMKVASDTLEKHQKSLDKPILTKLLPFNRFNNAESYHQKYFLQTFHKGLAECLKLTEEDLISSTAAAKLNSYVSGFGTVERFDAECAEFGLSSNMADYVREQMKNPKNVGC